MPSAYQISEKYQCYMLVKASHSLYCYLRFEQIIYVGLHPSVEWYLC